jgi:hypothetical protein
MSIATYAELQTAIGTWLNRSDLTSVAPDLITLAEASFDRRPECVDEVFTTLTLSASPTSLPSDFKEPISLYYNESEKRAPIDLVGLDELADRGRNYSATGRPMAASLIRNASQLLLIPEPDQSYTAYLQYRAALPRLSATQTTNWLLLGHPDIYLFGSLLQATPYLKHDERIAVWQSMLDRALAELRAQIARRVVGNTPVHRIRRPIG